MTIEAKYLLFNKFEVKKVIPPIGKTYQDTELGFYSDEPLLGFIPRPVLCLRERIIRSEDTVTLDYQVRRGVWEGGAVFTKNEVNGNPRDLTTNTTIPGLKIHFSWREGPQTK